MAFYPVIELQLENRLTRVYLQMQTSLFTPEDTLKLKEYVESIFSKNRSLLDHGKKNVLIIWGENGVNMADWWIWGEDESETEGATIEVFLFRDTDKYESPLITAEDGLKVLASEATR